LDKGMMKKTLVMDYRVVIRQIDPALFCKRDL
jgi:hypothetical protein